ncbi:hypothetical protein AB4084_32820, partial [Lysobacter sp. 2RAB21]
IAPTAPVTTPVSKHKQSRRRALARVFRLWLGRSSARLLLHASLETHRPPSCWRRSVVNTQLVMMKNKIPDTSQEDINCSQIASENY